MNEQAVKKSVFYAGNFLSASGGVRGPGEDLCFRFEATGWRVVRAGTHPVRLFRFIEILWKTLIFGRKADLCVVEVYSGRAFVWAFVAGQWLPGKKRKLILALHGGGLCDFDRRHPKKVEGLFRRAQKIVTPSGYLRKHFSERYPDTVYLPNAIDLSRYIFRERIKVRPLLCWLRAFHSLYQPLMAIETVRLLRADFPDIRLVMAGPDKGDGSLKAARRLIKAYHLQNNVEIIGGLKHSEVPGFLNSSDIFLNTTSLESFGVAMMEAGASGLCIVTTCAGEIPRIWEAGKNALLFNPGDPKGAAEAVKQLLCQPELAVRFSREARVNAERFGWDSILPEWEKILLTGKEGMER